MMLYVSRNLSTGDIGVVDTDDGVEEVISMTEFGECVLYRRVDIKGALLFEEADDHAVYQAVPYQPEETMSTLQIKTRMMTGVEVIVFHNTITGVVWDSSSIQRDTRLRLSDYANMVGDCIINRFPDAPGKNLILVFDDKLKEVSNYFLKMPRDSLGLCTSLRGVQFDIREVHRKSLRLQVYNSVAHTVGRRYVNDFVIPNEDEKFLQ